MGKFDGYLICTDLDGTFTLGHDIYGENAKYVKYFQENGGLFTVSTGRLPEHIKEFSDFVPNCPVITHNGAVIYDLENDEVLYKSPIHESLTEIYEYALNLDCFSIRAVNVYGLKTVCNILEKETVELNEEYLKIVFEMDDTEQALIFRNNLKDKFGEQYTIFMGWETGIECLAKDTHKGTAVIKLKEILGDRVNKVICVGDSESDAFMFRYADIGYAVDNASEEAKAAADRITIQCSEGAIAQIIKEIEKELKKIEKEP